MKLDAHQHFWNYNPSEYGWISEDMGGLRRDFTPRDLADAQAPIGFDGSIAVQARMTLEETRWLLELSDNCDRIKGVVGYVELCSPAAGEQIDRFKEHPKCVGFRHVVHDEPDDNFMLRKDFRRGLRELSDRSLVYDLLLFEKHLPVALEIVREFPNLRFVLDHISKPLIKDGILTPWEANICELARCENVTCKLSGMVTEADWAAWTPNELRPYLDVVLEAFGPKRMMIGSDWPVCLVADTYDRVMKVVIDYVSELSPDEQARILGGTCREVYGI